MILNNALKHISEQQPLIVKLHRFLVSLQAVNSEHGGKGEEPKARWIEDWLTENGLCEIQRFDSLDNRVPLKLRPNLVAHYNPNNSDRTLTQTKLLIIDDFGISPIDPELGASILEIIDKQSVNGGLLITSQIPPEQWYDLFNNPTIADAVLDRIIHRSNRVELKGESMRKKIKQK